MPDDYRSVHHGAMAVMVLLLVGCAAACGRGVEVSEGAMTLQYTEYEMRWKTRPNSNGANFEDRKKVLSRGPRTFKTVELDNKYLKVVVVPEAGGPVARVICKYAPEGGQDMFLLKDTCHNGIVGWESGVKVSFPYKEHGIRLPDQPASWRVVRHGDGAATIAMWHEFSRFTQPWNARMFGRYSNMLLSQHVTLRPGDASFTVTYRITNPTPYKQGRQLWNDALFPRYHTKEGVLHKAGSKGVKHPKTTAQWIFPAAHVSHHNGKDFRPYVDHDTPMWKVSAKKGASVFGWAMKHPFVGLYYPEPKVNRLRITDPAKAPGAKQFYNSEERSGPLLELWTGTDSIFEQVEHWIGPGEAFEYTLRYVMTTGIGKVDCANDDVAVNLEAAKGGDGVVELFVYREHDALSLVIDGAEAARFPRGVGPGAPLRYVGDEARAGGRYVVRAGEQVLMDTVLPVKLEADEQAYERIRQTLRTDLPANSERLGDSQTYGRNYRSAKYPAGTTDAGRIALRAGNLKAAIEHLTKATEAEPNDGEAWCLLGVAQLESGAETQVVSRALTRAVEAQPPCAEAWYYLALLALGGDEADFDTARPHLIALHQARPRHWEGRLLHAWLDGAEDQMTNRAKELIEEDPADPRAMWVLVQCAEAAKDDKLKSWAEAELAKLMKAPGAERRLDEFIAATKGRYMPPMRMK